MWVDVTEHRLLLSEYCLDTIGASGATVPRLLPLALQCLKPPIALTSCMRRYRKQPLTSLSSAASRFKVGVGLSLLQLSLFS